MKKKWLSLAVAAAFTSNVYAADAQTANVLPETHVLTTVQSVEALPALNAIDMQAAFQQDAQPMQMAALSGQEMKETEGAWINWAIAGGIGGVMNTAIYVGSTPNWTYGGAAYSFAAGAGGALIGGLPGPALYRATFATIGAYGASQPYRGYGWAPW